MTSPCSPRRPSRSGSTSADATAVRPDVGGLLPVFVLDRYEGYEVKRLQECTRAELDAWVEANAAALRDHGAGRSDSTSTTSCSGGAVGAASGGPYVVKAHGSELEYSMRGNAELSAWGGEVLAGARRRRSSAPSTSATSSREVCGTVERVHEIPPGVDVELWRLAPRSEALAGLVAEARRDPPNPGNANERLPDEGNAAAPGGLPRRRAANGRVLREADREQGCAGAARRASRGGCSRGDRRLRRLPRRAGGAGRRSRRPLHWPPRPPAPRPSARARRRRRRAVDLPGGLRHGRSRSRGGRLPADRGEPLGARRDRARAGGGLPARARRPCELPERGRGGASGAARRGARVAGRRPRGATRRSTQGRRRALELVERRKAASSTPSNSAAKPYASRPRCQTTRAAR